MAKPTPGKNYTIENQDSLSQLAAQAYGDVTLWRRIWDANQTRLRSGDPDLIFPGETVFIPELVERQLPSTPDPNKAPEGLYINIDGYEIRPVSAKIIRTIDTIANGFECVIPYENGLDIELDNRVKPYSYAPVKISIGSERILTGTLYTSRSSESNGSQLTLSGATNTANMVDSTMRPPYEFNNITLKEAIEQQAKPFNLKTIFEAETGGQFKRITSRQGQSIFKFLRDLARQRGVLLTCDEFGNIVVTQANINGAPVASYEQGVSPGVTGWGINADGRKRFSVYRAIGRSPLGTSNATANDTKVPMSRFKDIQADDTTDGDIEAAAIWARNKEIAEALTFPLNFEGWRDTSGNLFKENTIIALKSKSMFFPQGFNFLVNKVQYNLGDGGRSTTLSFVPPTVYTQGEIIEPW
jgi:prophage tail gpP-like protein